MSCRCRRAVATSGRTWSRPASTAIRARATARRSRRSMPLLAVPYRPSWVEHLILSNRNILADQMAFLRNQLPKNARAAGLRWEGLQPRTLDRCNGQAHPALTPVPRTVTLVAIWRERPDELNAHLTQNAHFRRAARVDDREGVRNTREPLQVNGSDNAPDPRSDGHGSGNGNRPAGGLPGGQRSPRRSLATAAGQPRPTTSSSTWTACTAR